MNWLFIAFLNPLLHGAANILDNYVSNRLFKNLTVLIFYSALFDLVFLPLIFFIGLPKWIEPALIPLFAIVGLTNILYLYPYYRALQSDDTSTVSSLFSLGKIFVPLLAFLIVGEVISPLQYLGFFIIIFTSALLTLNNARAIKFNPSFFYMLLCSFILSFEIVIYKYIFTKVDWITGLTYSSIASFLIIMTMGTWKKNRVHIVKEFSTFKNVAVLFGAEELLTFGGLAAITNAVSRAPVTVVEAIGSSQPFFVLLYALILGRFFPRAFRERPDKKSIIKKFFLFTIMILGIILITLNGAVD